MATSNIKKNAKGYNYKYTDLAQIHEYLEERGFEYYQYVERIGEDDYIMTIKIIDGKESQPIRGCRIVQGWLDGKSNPAQEQGSALTYARRYSLLMAFGLATTDDDAQLLDRREREGMKLTLRTAVNDAFKAQSVDSLQDVWLSYKELQSNEEFRNAVAKRKKDLQ